MIFITGDTHRNFKRIELFTERFNTTKDDAIIVLGDAGINYCGKYEDDNLKRHLNRLPITLLCVRGNHEERPENIDSYKKATIEKECFKGSFFYEQDYNNLYFFDNGLYEINNSQCLVVNGAYSVDKHYRLMNGGKWFKEEQLNDEEKKQILSTMPQKVDFVLSHTCPHKYIPREMFIQGLNQDLVDNSMEEFLDEVENKLEYKTWYCGHWHTNKTHHNMRFMYGDIIEFGKMW